MRGADQFVFDDFRLRTRSPRLCRDGLRGSWASLGSRRDTRPRHPPIFERRGGCLRGPYESFLSADDAVVERAFWLTNFRFCLYATGFRGNQTGSQKRGHDMMIERWEGGRVAARHDIFDNTKGGLRGRPLGGANAAHVPGSVWRRVACVLVGGDTTTLPSGYERGRKSW